MAETAAIPVSVQRRLQHVLQHLAKSKVSSCSGTLDTSACAGEDIEDLGKASQRCHSADALDEDEKVLFDPQRFAETQKPLLEASTLPSECYSSRKWYLRELSRVFMPAWLLVGRADEVVEPGSYLAVDTEWGGPVVVCRGRDGQLYAFANVCAHRGAKILPDGRGKASPVGMTCPYHAWTYEFNGTLKWAPGMESSKSFEESHVRLASVRLDTLHGFIFVCHSKEAKPLLEVLGDLPEKLAPWFGPQGTVKDMVCVQRREYQVPCNWKFIMENTCETYHTAVVHKGSLGPMKSSPMGPHSGDWDAVRVPTERSVVPLPTDFEGERFPLPTFADHSNFVNIFPALQINVTWDCIWWMNILPTGEESTRIQMGFVFPKATVQLDRFPSVLERYLHRWHVAVSEDNEISLNQQRGVRSAFRVPGRFCQLEFGTHNFDNWLLSKMLDGRAGAWDPGQRVFVGDNVFSNDDKHMLDLVQDSLEKLEVEGDYKSFPKLQRPLAPRNTGAKGVQVCVTGATGFIGLHLVKQLLEGGYIVKVAVRDASNERKMAPLLALRAHAAGQACVNIIGGCNALSPGSYDEAVADCEVCFHLASPFWMDDRIVDPAKELVAPAEQGTLNVLGSCSKVPCMRRVVITSSFGAVMNTGGNSPWPPDFHYAEKHWNITSAPVDGRFPDPQNVHAYRWSKTIAEKAAWDFVATRKPHFDIAAILPPMVLGGNLQKLTSTDDLNQSSLMIFKMLSGQMPHVSPGSVGFVDVKDVARAHVLAAQSPRAGGQRYLCSGTAQTWLQVADSLRSLFPGRPVPRTCADGSMTQPCVTIDNTKIRSELGLDFIPLDQTLREQGEAFIRAGLLS
eukprot:TRINITY_DN4265_c0_g1_i2.p1 TRINITY_DN4265_c0_g1~~TRINITY_DN4265_c0_g1_i2.p1  ORF type:complete len:868 (+),score=158.89 TRINITY_DN4265_c0_g1_i2:58-2604(+)